MPANFAQKQEFRAMLKSMNKFVVAENFDEALVAYTECFKSNLVLPDNINRLFENFHDEINSPTTQFWIMTKALKAFYIVNNRLPVQGAIPDMISLPEYYISLQKIYIAKSEADTAIMRQYVDQFLGEVNANNQVVAPVTDDELTMFVRGCLQIEVLKMNTIRKEQEQPDWSAEVADMMSDPGSHCPRWLIAMKAFEQAAFKSTDSKSFGSDQSNLEDEFAAMKVEAKVMTDAMS